MGPEVRVVLHVEIGTGIHRGLLSGNIEPWCEGTKQFDAEERDD